MKKKIMKMKKKISRNQLLQKKEITIIIIIEIIKKITKKIIKIIITKEITTINIVIITICKT
jgi:hypothetical protein